ncbi:MAG: YbbR-like domain-containing protein [Bacteroidota bacterium]
MADKVQNKIDSQKNNKKMRVFLLFLSLSFLFWMLIKLSKDYVADVNFKVSYTDLPANKLLQKEPDNNLVLTVKAIGFKLLNYKLKKPELVYSLKDVHQKSNDSYYSITGSNFNLIQAQLPNETSLLKIKPDSLFFDFGVKISKKVKIIPNLNLKFRSGYDLVNKIELNPKHVIVSGPQGIIDSISEIKTDLLKLNGLAESFQKDLTLHIPNKKVTLSTDHVNIKANIDKFTEGNFTIKVKVINIPKNYILSIYPKEVKVVFKVALTDYNKVVPNGFKVICDFKEAANNNLDYLIPKVTEQPEMISSVKIVPNKIEYLIKK